MKIIITLTIILVAFIYYYENHYVTNNNFHDNNGISFNQKIILNSAKSDCSNNMLSHQESIENLKPCEKRDVLKFGEEK